MVPLYGPLIGQGKSLMRTAFATVILAAAITSAAQAQTPPASTPPAPPTAAPPAAPTATRPAAPPTAAPAAPTTDQPAAPGAAAPAATPPAEAAPPPPTLPTTGPGAVLINIVEKVCVPLVRGGNLDQLAPQIQGAKKNRRDNTWTVPLGGNRDYQVILSPPGVNKDVCRGEVHYGFDDEKAIVSAFNVWSFLHQPELILQANYVEVDADGVKRVRKSWEHIDQASSTAVNFSEWTKPDDTPLNKNFSTGEIYYQERKLQ